MRVGRWMTVMVVLLATGCGDRAAPANDVVNFYNWADYAAPDALPSFTATTGIRVNFDTFDSNEMLLSKLLVGRSGYDVVVPTATFLAKEGAAGLLHPIDRTQLRNYASLDTELMARLAVLDPGNRYGVPYAVGTTGLGINVDRIRERMPDAPLTSWALLLDPDIVANFKDCGVMMIDSVSDVVPVVLRYLGRDPASEDLGDLDAAMATLNKVRPFIRYFNAEQYLDDFANGEVCLGIVWSGGMLQAAEQAGKGQHLRYEIPVEGTVLWLDTLAIPADAPHLANAYRLIDHLLGARIAAGFTNTMFYPSGVAAARAWVEPALRDDPTLYPPPEVLKRLYTDPLPSVEYERLRLRRWDELKAGRRSGSKDES
jgi:putrescine transport system substrate-binding protein